MAIVCRSGMLRIAAVRLLGQAAGPSLIFFHLEAVMMCAFYRWLGLLLLLMLASVPAGQAASLPGSADPTSSTASSPQEMRESLDDVISMLENDEQRSALLADLRQLRQASEAQADQGGKAGSQGLLGAIADSLDSLSGQNGESRTLIDAWSRRAHRAGDDFLARVNDIRSLSRLAIDFALTLAAWAGLAFILLYFGRRIARHYDVRLELPEEPAAGVLIRYFLRRILPWGIAFAATLIGTLVLTPTLGMTLATMLAYTTLCGMVFAAACEVVFSLFTYGHRRVALRILRRRALWPLFFIGALVALGDAANASRPAEALGMDLARFVSELANLAAALLVGGFVVRFKRPIRHLIRNRPYSQRRDRKTWSELIHVLGGLWHIPALLTVAVSLVAIATYSGDARTIFARAVASAGLLVLTLIANGLIRRSAQRVPPRRQSQYLKRLTRFGYTLAHLVCWFILAELISLVWGGSLMALGSGDGIGERIVRALFGIGVTILLAWLAWIIADTAIYRAMTSTARSQRGRARRARAETITPLLRNMVFVTILVIATIVALANLGVNVTPLLAGAGVIGLAVGFGAQTLVQDLITGLFILIEDTLAIDDFVDVGGHMGTVEKLSLRTIRLRDLDGIVHSVPFSQIKAIQNYSREFGYALFRIRVPHGRKIDDAIRVIQSVGNELRNDPILRFSIWSALEMQGVESFDAGAAIVRARFKTAPIMQWDVARAFNLRLKQYMDDAGIDLGMPRMSVNIENAEILQAVAEAAGSQRETANEGNAAGHDAEEGSAHTQKTQRKDEPRDGDGDSSALRHPR